MDRIRNFGFILKNLERLYTKRFRDVGARAVVDAASM